MAARKRMRLSDRGIRGLIPGLYADGDGLLMQVTKNKARTWILRTMIHKKRRDMGLGSWPTVSLKEAREKAFQYRKIARDGGDPFAVRNKANAPAPSFKKAADAVHKTHALSWKNEKHASQWINTLNRYAFPFFGESRVDHIRSEDIVRALSPIWLKKPETARRVLQRIGTVLLWAKGNGHLSSSPSDEISAARNALPKQSDKPKHHTSLPYKDVPRFITKLQTWSASDPIKLAFEYLILTATRTNETLQAKWQEVDFDKRVWTIPPSRMKARREHQVPLSERCLEILQSAQRLSDDLKGYVFSGTISGKSLSNMVFLMTLKRMGVKITAHGFRSSFRVWCAEQTQFPREVAEAALAHVVKDATEAAYMRSTFFDARREMMERWAQYVTQEGKL